jgi:hypothetical protein
VHRILSWAFFLRPRARVFAAVLGLAAQSARADFIGAIHIDFQSGNSAGSYEFILPMNQDPYQWTLAAPVNIYGSDDQQLIGTLRELHVELEGDPGVSLGFNVTANNSPTLVTVTSATVTFAPLFNPMAFASAAITVTDAGSNGANATGTFGGSLAYQALFNGSSVFANLVSPVSAGVDSSATGSDRLPALGMISIPGAVTSIQSQFSFVLSANDTASGTSRFNVVPEPASLILVVLGLLCFPMALWRRTR